MSECAPILVADGGLTCEHCDHVFDPESAPSTSIPSATLYQCPACQRYSSRPEGRPSGDE